MGDLDKERGRIGLEELGMAPDTLAQFREGLTTPEEVTRVVRG